MYTNMKSLKIDTCMKIPETITRYDTLFVEIIMQYCMKITVGKVSQIVCSENYSTSYSRVH